MSAGAFVAAFVLAAAGPVAVRARTELVQRNKGALRATVDADLFRNNLRDALGDVLGCGEDSDIEREKEKLNSIEKKLLPIWNSLPKSASGRIERPLLRYIAHRYFAGTSSIMLRGFERSRPANESLAGADILSQQVPAYVEAALESHHAQEHGFDLHDAVQMVATLRKLIADSDSALLEKVYKDQQRSMDEPLQQPELMMVVHTYMVHWLLGGDEASIQQFLDDTSLLRRAFPHWGEILNMMSGQIKAFDYVRMRAGSRLAQKYSFADAREVVWGITSSFASFWDDECSIMKDKLVEMDTHHTGRVPLKWFYSRKLSAEWRFAESEDYLRQLGALDETSRWHGKEVIIPNYIGAASNCIVATPHYLICCQDSCESTLGEIEAAIGAPVASPEQILGLVGNMTSMTSLDDDEPVRLTGSLERQLGQIAAAHGGKIPLHGRLFAQWLHYAFPRECPFPHKSGATSQMAPNEFGEYIVSEQDRLKHAEPADGAMGDFPVQVEKETMQWMSQWSSHEELMSGYTMELHGPWEAVVAQWSAAFGIIVLLIATITGAVGYGGKLGASSSLLPKHGKAHFV